MLGADMTQLFLYTSKDGQTQVQLRAEWGTVWPTQLEMAELFNASKQNISLHLKNVFQGGELREESVVKESLTVQIEVSHACTKEARAVDEQDEAELKALEDKIKHRKDYPHD